ncbi:MAG: type II toxin-antitoxin system prevent-host-death family antitoxin [Candidatus Hydrogenedentota bacterium]
MKTVGAYQAKTHFSQLLAAVEAGETVTITKHGTPVAEIRGLAQDAAATKAAAIARIRKWKKFKLPKGMTIKDLIHDGHKY